MCKNRKFVFNYTFGVLIRGQNNCSSSSASNVWARLAKEMSIKKTADSFLLKFSCLNIKWR